MDYMDDSASKPQSHFEYSLPKQHQGDNTALKQQVFEYMNQLTGWCSYQKGGILFDLVRSAQPKIMLEIGVWGGKSLVPMAYALKLNGEGIIYGIDPWDNMASVEETLNEGNKDWWGAVDHISIMNGLIKKIGEFQLNDQIQLIRNTSEMAAPIEDIDILHVDGNHSDKTSYFDVLKWVPLMRKGGYIIFDDMTWNENGRYTTARAVGWLDTHCIKIAEYTDNCTWGIWQKP